MLFEANESTKDWKSWVTDGKSLHKVDGGLQDLGCPTINRPHSLTLRMSRYGKIGRQMVAYEVLLSSA